MKKIKREDVVNFLETLDPTTKRFTFQLFKDRGDKKRAFHEVYNVEDVVPWMQDRQDEGYGVYVAVNEMQEGYRDASHVTRIRGVWQDDDHGWDGDYPLEPTMVVETSKGKYHRYWLLAEGEQMTHDQFRGVMRCLVGEHGCDPAVSDVSRVLRVAGTLHLKDKPFRCHIVERSGKRYTVDELVEAFRMDEVFERSREIVWGAKPPLRGMTQRIAERLIDRYAGLGMAESYHDWLGIGMMLHHQYEGGLEGLELWIRVARDEEACQASAEKWETFDAGKYARDPLTMATMIDACRPTKEMVLDLIEEDGIDPQEVIWESKFIEDQVARAEVHKAIVKKFKGVGVTMKIIKEVGEEIGKGGSWDDDVFCAVEVLRTLGAEDYLSVSGVLYRYEGGCWNMWSLPLAKAAVQECLVDLGVKVKGDKVNRVLSALTLKVEAGADWEWNRVEDGAVAFKNGVLGMDGVLRGHRRDNYLRAVVGVDWVEGAECERFQQFLWSVSRGDQDIVGVLRDIIGYAMQNHCRDEKLFVLVGSGANGKSVYLGVLEAIFEGVCSYVPPHMFGSAESCQGLSGMYLNVEHELDNKKPFGKDRDIKAVTSGQAIEMKTLYKQKFREKVFCTQVYAVNEMPLYESIKGMERRLVAVPFDRVYSAEEQDSRLLEKLVADGLEGVVRWGLEGYRERCRKGGGGGLVWADLGDRVREMGEDIAVSSDPFREWIEEGEYIEVIGNVHSKLKAKDVYDMYLEFMSGLRGNHRTMIRKEFVRAMESLDGVVYKNVGQGYKYFCGIRKVGDGEDRDKNKNPFSVVRKDQ